MSRVQSPVATRRKKWKMLVVANIEILSLPEKRSESPRRVSFVSCRPNHWTTESRDPVVQWFGRQLTQDTSFKILQAVPLYFGCLKKNLNVSRLSEHPPVWERKMSKRLDEVIGCKDKTCSSHLIGFPDGSIHTFSVLSLQLKRIR